MSEEGKSGKSKLTLLPQEDISSFFFDELLHNLWPKLFGTVFTKEVFELLFMCVSVCCVIQGTVRLLFDSAQAKKEAVSEAQESFFLSS